MRLQAEVSEEREDWSSIPIFKRGAAVTVPLAEFTLLRVDATGDRRQLVLQLHAIADALEADRGPAGWDVPLAPPSDRV